MKSKLETEIPEHVDLKVLISQSGLTVHEVIMRIINAMPENSFKVISPNNQEEYAQQLADNELLIKTINEQRLQLEAKDEIILSLQQQLAPSWVKFSDRLPQMSKWYYCKFGNEPHERGYYFLHEGGQWKHLTEWLDEQPAQRATQDDDWKQKLAEAFHQNSFEDFDTREQSVAEWMAKNLNLEQ